MAGIIESEIELQRSLESLKADLEILPEYTALSVFNFIDTNKSGTVTTDEIALFLKRAGYYATDLEALAVIRRIDTDADSTINVSEFTDFMRRLIPAPRPVPLAVDPYVPRYYPSYLSYRYPYYSRYYSPYYYPFRSYYDPLYTYVPSYLRTSLAAASPVKTTKIGNTTFIESPSRTTAYTSSPVRTSASPLDRSYISPYTGRVIYY
jgi:hypothetical protein